MAGKEKKGGGMRQLNKDNLMDHDKPATNDDQKPKRGRKAKAVTPVRPEEAKLRAGRKKKVEEPPTPPLSDDAKPTTPQRNRKQFLEKELEDILENATGRNTPLDDRTFFLPKSRREPEDDTLSVRSLSNFLRSRRAAEIEDDVLSLRSVKVRKDDDDACSVRSLPGRPGKPGRKTGKNTVTALANTKGKVGKTKMKAAPAVKKKVVKTKEIKQTKKKPIKLPTKIAAKKRSALLVKKKVLNAKIAALCKKRTVIKGKGVQALTGPAQVQPGKSATKAGAVSVVERNGDISTDLVKPAVKVKSNVKRKIIKKGAAVGRPSDSVKDSEPSDSTQGPELENTADNIEVPAAGSSSSTVEMSETAKSSGSTGISEMGNSNESVDVSAVVQETTVQPKKPRGRRRKVDSVPAANQKVANGPKSAAAKRRWENAIHYDVTPSPADASVIIVQPRLGPKVRKMSLESNLAATPVVPAVASPVIPVTTPAAVLPNGGASAPPTSTPYFIQTVANFSALKAQPTAQGDWLVTPSGVVLIQAVHPPERNSPPAIPFANSATDAVADAPVPCSGEDLFSVAGEDASVEAVAPSSATAVLAVVVPSPKHSPVSLSAVVRSSTSSKCSSIASPAPSPSDSAVAPSSSPTPALTVAESAVVQPTAGSNVPSPALSPSLSGSAVAPLPALCGTSPPNSLLSEKAKEAEPAQSMALPRIPVAKNVQELLELKSQMEGGEPSTAVELKSEKKGKHLFPERMSLVERRFSHDGSFAPIPSRITRRTGSCERLMEHSPKNILELGSQPLPISPAVLPFETDSSYSVALPKAIESIKLMCVTEMKTDTTNCEPEFVKDDLESLKEFQGSEEIKCVNAENQLITSDFNESGEDVKPSTSSLTELMQPRSAGRTKKYSRSLDSCQKLLPGIRRRSHPEPKIINIVTSEDGSRQGLTLVEELRQKIISTDSSAVSNDSVDSNDSPNVPYPEQSMSPPLPVVVESPEDLASKETMLSALGLRSLKAAAELVQRKKDQALVVAATNNSISGGVSNNYTGTLKTVIKISRPEKKGNGRMIYKASIAGTGPDVPAVAVTELEEPRDSPPLKESVESGDEDGKNGGGKAKALVIPEKASSFSIHPHRMCSDVCTYCFGKFGLLDTPCHIAQLKDGEKRRNILDSEVHLTLDSCLCDACFRHVDKKSNGSSFTEKKPTKRQLMVRKRKEAVCCVENCEAAAQHSVRRKSLIKLKNSLSNKLQLDQLKLDKLLPANLVTLCNRHIYWVDYFMSCGICNKRLSTVHMYRVGPEVLELNGFLGADGIPTVLTEKRFLCKLCQCYASIRLKAKDPSEMTASQRNFYETCRRKILQSHGIEVPDSEAEAELTTESTDKNKIKSSKKLKPSSTVTNGEYETDASQPPTKALVEDFSDLRAKFKPTGATTEHGFHKCNSTIQFSKATKDLFYQLQQPYGNHSSFFRHLVMLEKYFRSGDLVLSSKAEPLAVKYVNGVQNRLRSYDGMPKMSSRPFTLTAIPAAPSPSTSAAPTASTSSRTPTPQPQPTPLPPPQAPAITAPVANPLNQLQSAVHNIGIKPDISITSVGSEPRKLTPKIQENLRALANRASKPGGQTRAVILNRTVGGQKQSLVQVTTGGKTIHLTLSQFRRIQQMQIRKKQYLENQAKGLKPIKPKANGPSDAASEVGFPHIPKALSVSVSKVSSVDLTKSPPRPD